ncbi:PREDICTED: protein TAP1-like [Nicotiana attenuata]|uniref:Thionin-like protein 2 n=1 Tax=Nicotiana attenuata TaxID=49451 RepID=A0A314L6Z8_NICAT|nr:PREDICTED: protein TAP1-like [Nicotiana attenuata]OIT37400.1 hypothetical protein A4A49_06186 [Nicotiana attenuata]
MEGKKVMAIALMLIILVEGSMAGDYGSCIVDCIKDKAIDCIMEPQICLPACAAKCAIQLPSSSTHAANYACNIGCALSQCKNFMILNDGEKLGVCMASCSDKYCATKAAAA